MGKKSKPPTIPSEVGPIWNSPNRPKRRRFRLVQPRHAMHPHSALPKPRGIRTVEEDLLEQAKRGEPDVSQIRAAALSLLQARGRLRKFTNRGTAVSVVGTLCGHVWRYGSDGTIGVVGNLQFSIFHESFLGRYPSDSRARRGRFEQRLMIWDERRKLLQISWAAKTILSDAEADVIHVLPITKTRPWRSDFLKCAKDPGGWHWIHVF